eukprot:CAMPEP_0184327000 /NCGR_PEP_ID=MMETSP1049-20130417/142863_1 /TAXON_ID=77928 /ORGANISM="Proteomonas sulcata, Strain CCMP704" /LENGTH=368 /DNA_ID=CAMNT_0026649231 /DNA_START=246 /DNA_END=1352 /DNA_ORIENTATION=-
MDPKGNGVRGLSASAQPVRQVAELKTGLSMEYFSLTPAGAGTKTPLLFIHGSFHGGWCWAEHWLPYFADEGYPVYAVSLRGTTGSPQAEGVKSVKLQEHTEDLGAFISEVLPPGSEPVLVGHSFGGMYAQKVAESGKVPLKGLAMLCSVAPSGNSGTVGRYIFSQPFLAWKIVLAFVFKKAGEDLGICRTVFFSPDSPPDSKIEEYMARFKADGAIGLDVSDVSITPSSFPRPIKHDRPNTSTAYYKSSRLESKSPPVNMKAQTLRRSISPRNMSFQDLDPKPLPGAEAIPSQNLMGADGCADWLDRAPPLLVAGTPQDKVVDLPALQETAKFYKVEALMLNGAHEVMLEDCWKENAEAVKTWIDSVV